MKNLKNRINSRFDPVDYTKVLLKELAEDNIVYVDLRLPGDTCDEIIKAKVTQTNLQFNCIATLVKKIDGIEFSPKTANYRIIGMDWVGQEDSVDLGNLKYVYDSLAIKKVTLEDLKPPLSIHWGELTIAKTSKDFDMLAHLEGFELMYRSKKLKRIGHGLLGLEILEDYENATKGLSPIASEKSRKDKIERDSKIMKKYPKLKDSDIYFKIYNMLKDNKDICYEISPISNDVLGYYKVKENIAKRYFLRDYKITINSDNNTNFNTIGLTHDFIAVAIDWDLSKEQLIHLAQNSMDCSEASDKTKQLFRSRKEEWLKSFDDKKNKGKKGIKGKKGAYRLGSG